MKCLLAALLAVLLVSATTAARADAGLVLNGSMATGSSFITGAGHAAVYLSRICPVSAVKVRMCAPGEAGSVLSNYKDFMEDRPYEWNVVSAELFLYGVDRAEYRPLFATRDLRAALQSRYRQDHLATICPIGKCSDDPDANWRDLVGATLVRSVYIFEAHTTEEQDAALVAYLNATQNVSEYHGFTDNCADFAERILNFYFHGAIDANRLNDFGVTGPKAIARSLAMLAKRHPEMDLRVARFAQIPSDLRLSDDPREATESMFKAKKWVVPLAWFEPHEIAILPLLYWAHGRLNLEDAVRNGHEGADLAALHGSTDPRGGASLDEVRTAMRKDIDDEIAAAQRSTAVGQIEPGRILANLESLPLQTDAQGRAWVTVNGARVGLSADAWQPEGLGAAFYYKMQLARLSLAIHGPERSSEDASELKSDWSRLERAREVVMPAAAAPAPSVAIVATGVRAGS